MPYTCSANMPYTCSGKINTTQNKRLHQLLNQTGLTDEKRNLVRTYTDGRSASSKDLSIDEAKSLISYLLSLPGAKPATDRKKVFTTNGRQWQPPANLDDGFQRNAKRFDSYDPKNSNASRTPMRQYIKHLCHLMGMIDRNVRGPYRYNYDRMNRFIENIGSNNPRKVHLHLLSYYELKKVCIQVEAMYRKEMTRYTPVTRKHHIANARKQHGIRNDEL